MDGIARSISNIQRKYLEILVGATFPFETVKEFLQTNHDA
jgi:hypothetical protein